MSAKSCCVVEPAAVGASHARPLLGRALIFEPAFNGHHLQYVRVLIEALHGKVREIRVSLGADALSSREFAVHLKHLQALPGLTFSEEVERARGGNMYRLVADAARALRDSLRAHTPDRVYVPYGDGLIQALGAARVLAPRLIPEVPIELLIMRGGFAYPSAHPRRKLRHEALYALSARAKLDVLHVLDPLVHAEIQHRGGHLGRCARLIPEAVEPLPRLDRQQARAQLGVPTDGRYFVCAGALDVRKGIGYFLRAASRADLPKDVRFLFVGRVARGMESEWQSARDTLGERLVVVDRYVTDDQFACAILAADVVVVPYPEHQGSSGLLVRAAAGDRYLITSDYGWIGWATRTFGLGMAVDVRYPSSFEAALQQGLERSTSYTLGDAGKRFVGYHDAANQQAHWTARICELAAVPARRAAWEQVLRPS